MTAYYNEFDPKAAAWLRELIKAGHIADGVVDERSIADVRPDELTEFTQCHFFAGIGVWSYALRRAGWRDDRPVWTGSCPCQPFSSAGKGGGFDDERHLWPHFHWLISNCRPAIVLGEQVASKDGLGWLDLVQADLEGTGYTSGAVDLCAAGVGAPHIRQRLWWFAERMADTDDEGPQRRAGMPERSGERAFGSSGVASGLADAAVRGCEPVPNEPPAGIFGASLQPGEFGEQSGDLGAALNRASASGQADSLWSASDWLFCRDGKWRPVEPGTFPLAHGSPARVGRLRGYGNAINAEAAQAFIEAYQEAKADQHFRLMSEMTFDVTDDGGIFG